MTIDEALTGAAGLAGIQWVLYGAASQCALREAVTALLHPPATLGECRLLRAKAKPGRKLTAYYTLTLNGVAGAVAPTRAIAVTWTLPSSQATATAAAPPPAVMHMEAEALASGRAAPFQRLHITNAAWRMQIDVAPLDPTFPQLVSAMTPTHVAAMLAAYGQTPPDSSPANGWQVTTIRYRPRQRHVLRYDCCAPPTGRTPIPPFFAKLCRHNEGAQLATVVDWVAAQLARSTAGVIALRPQAWVQADQLLLYPYAPGTQVSRLLKAGQPVHPLLYRAGAALRALHVAPPATLALPRKTFAGEVKATSQAGEHLALLAPALSASLCMLLEQVQERYARLPAVEPVFTHSDFKADHLLADQEGLTLIDFDSCALADPAADVGKFLADLCWWRASGGQFELAQAQAAFLAGYGLDHQPDLGARARLYATLILAKSTVRRLNLFNESWLAQSQTLLNCATALLHSS
ncbi:MAG: aminoglycoside phosphotransferase family protein [Caldilineaceae bacterium]